jgi:Flp pilus assembly protein TadD
MIDDWPNSPGNFQEFSWFLATCPDLSFQEPRLAESMAERAVALAPEQGDSWSALGVAHYRTGDWKKAEAAFQKAIQLKDGGASIDWLFRAMICWNLGDHSESRRWFDQAIAEINHHCALAEELARIRDEAEILMRMKIGEPKEKEGQR